MLLKFLCVHARDRFAIGLLFVFSCLACTPAHAAAPVTPEQLQQAIEPLASAHAGEVAVSVQVLTDQGQPIVRWDMLGDQVMPTASLIKLPVMIEAYRQAEAGRLSLETQLMLKEEDKVPGSGILTEHFSPGLQLSLRDAVRLMIRYSDNTATNLVIDQLGISATAQTMAEWGFPETQLHSQVFRRDTSVALERSERYGLGSTTANDMTELLVRLERGELVSAAASREMLGHLATCDDTAKLPRDLPSECHIAHKTGSVNRSRTAAGIISGAGVKFAICVLTDKNEDSSWSKDNAADVLIGTVALRVYEILMQNALQQNEQVRTIPSATAPTAAGRDESSATRSLQLGSVGELVESLQRTLNERIHAGLSVDGDFGPATEQAVKRFQEQNQLEVNGIVAFTTWKTLGPLIEQDAPVPPPAEINAHTFPRSAALDPLAPPAVSAKAWAVLDVSSAHLLSQAQGDERLPMASTTKVMTALLVLELAASNPQVLDEVITFSARADQTIGSTAGVRAGEQIATGELLYGLLLPSGNDAAVALAEHFGPRLVTKSTADVPGSEAAAEPTGYDQFVAAMNTRASELGLSNSHFANPNGLSDPEHFSSASDLARLALVALQIPKMREIMQCPQRGATVISRDGYSRNLLWENTNRLLSQAGFSGMKTGTTEASGACLIAVGGQGPDSSHTVGQTSETPAGGTIVVVLGCSSSDARYVDARNLFAWAWRQ